MFSVVAIVSPAQADSDAIFNELLTDSILLLPNPQGAAITKQDFMVRYADTVLHFFLHGDTLMIAEGLVVFRVKVAELLSDKTIADAHIRRDTGCTVVALGVDGTMQVNPDPQLPMQIDAEMLLIGSSAGQKRFFELYSDAR